MDHAIFQSTIERIVGAGDFEALADYLADDVEFKLTITVGSPANGEVRGKQAVIDYLTNVADADGDEQDRSPETFGSHERFVIAGDDGLAITKSGVRARSEYAFVFDVSDGLITRMLIHHDLSLVVGPRRKHSVRAGRRLDGARAGVPATRTLQEA
jgi:ketosteroid isomerase-like protein